MIFHSITKTDWAKAKANALYSPESLTKEGFIHCSSQDQLVAITNLVFSKRDDILILEIDAQKVTSKVLLEDLKGHGRFPHIYGPLNLDAVVNVHAMEVDDNPNSKVSFKLPPALRQKTEQIN